MQLRKRIQRAEEETTHARAVPLLVIDVDGTARVGNKPTTREAFEAEYGEAIEAERKRGRRVFGIDFRGET